MAKEGAFAGSFQDRKESPAESFAPKSRPNLAKMRTSICCLSTLTLARDRERRLLLLSDQGSSQFVALDRDNHYEPVARFTCAGADSSDGIEMVDVPMGPAFPHGLFCCHTDITGRPTLISPWDLIINRLNRATSGSQ